MGEHNPNFKESTGILSDAAHVQIRLNRTEVADVSQSGHIRWSAGSHKVVDLGRTATFVMRAEVLSYSRSRGLFAGISLEGSTLRSDGSANKKLYGRSLNAKEIVRQGKVGVPASGRQLISLLDTKSPKNQSDHASLKE